MTPDQIKKEAENFFEWPSDKRDQVTYTSCLLFAEHCAKIALKEKETHSRLTKEEAASKQDWRGMDGATAFHLIERHAEGWNDVGTMMNAWLEANQFAQASNMVWRPIEEAPKDGTRVLLYWPKFGSNPRQEIGYFEMQKYHSKPTPYWWSSNAVKNYGVRWYRDYQPTHWQPLPQPPEAV